jgi:hemerythrin-like metal-binding protein
MASLTRLSDLSMRMMGHDHQEIAEMLQEINLNANGDGNLGERIRRLQELIRLTRSHFTLEEGLMAATKYPDMGIHALRHRWLLDQIRRTAAQWNQGDDALEHAPVTLLWQSHNTHSESEDGAFEIWMNDDSKSILTPVREITADRPKSSRTKPMPALAMSSSMADLP